MTYGETLRTIRMRPVAGVGQACRIIPLPGDGDVILEGPADVLDVVRLVRLPDDDGPVTDRDPLPDGADLDWVRVMLRAVHGRPT